MLHSSHIEQSRADKYVWFHIPERALCRQVVLKKREELLQKPSFHGDKILPFQPAIMVQSIRSMTFSIQASTTISAFRHSGSIKHSRKLRLDVLKYSVWYRCIGFCFLPSGVMQYLTKKIENKKRTSLY